MQDLLVHALTGLSVYAVEGFKSDVVDHEVNIFTCNALFATVTNVNFDPERFVTLIKRCVELRESLKKKVEAAGGNVEAEDTRQHEGAAEQSVENVLGGGILPAAGSP